MKFWKKESGYARKMTRRKARAKARAAMQRGDYYTATTPDKGTEGRETW